MEAIQTVATNAELLLKIFKMLNLQDQIQTTSACKEFEYIIKNFIWNFKFKEIKIKEPTSNIYYIEFTNTAGNEYFIMENEYQTFFPIIAKHIQKLYVCDNSKAVLTEFNHFENLKILEFCNTKVTRNDLNCLVTNCPKLQTINFIYCENLNNSYFDLNKRGQIETLAQVKLLQHLKLVTYYYFDLSVLNEILNRLHLKSLDINADFCTDDPEVGHLKNCQHLEHLSIQSFKETESWLQFEEIYLKKFENLTALTLSGNDIFFTDNNMATLAEKCNKLQVLTLIDWKMRIKEFPKQLKLKKLTLNNCCNLTWKNLQNILGELNLEEFVSVYCEYKGMCNFFYDTYTIANTLQIIDIKTEQNQEFVNFFKYINNTAEKLKILRYEFTKKSPFKVLQNCLNLCKNLQELFIKNVAIPIEDLMKFKKLKILKLFLFPSMSLSYLETLLTHPSLVNISLEISKKMENNIENGKLIKYDSDDDDEAEDAYDIKILKENCSETSISFHNFDTSLLQFIKVHFMIFDKHQDLFLDLLNLKTNLKLTFYCYENPEEMLNQIFLTKLLNNKKFPSHIKYIKILNKYYDCKDLLENFTTTVDDISNYNNCLTLTL